MDLDDKRFAPPALLAFIGQRKDELADPATAIRQADNFWEETAAKVYEAYQRDLAESDAADFDDLLLRVVFLFEQHPDVLARYQRRWQYVLVDEYQDTNRAQYRLCALLAAVHRNLAVVGDDDQSIYSWRGADLRNILDFERDWPDAKVVKLEQNYRSTQTILDAEPAVEPPVLLGAEPALRHRQTGRRAEQPRAPHAAAELLRRRRRALQPALPFDELAAELVR